MTFVVVFRIRKFDYLINIGFLENQCLSGS